MDKKFIFIFGFMKISMDVEKMMQEKYVEYFKLGELKFIWFLKKREYFKNNRRNKNLKSKKS